MWATLLERHGRKGLDAALQPAILAAQDGFVVAPRIALDWTHNRDKLRDGVNAGEYPLSNDDVPTIGSVVRLPALAATLRKIAASGRDGFYAGSIAEDIVDTLRNAGGLHTLDDFLDHRTEVVTPISTVYRGYQIWQCPPNGPGVAMLMMLNILEGFDLPVYAPLSVERLHLEAEASRQAFLVRERYVGDPKFVALDLDRLLSAEFAAEMRRQIRLDRVCELAPVAPPMHPSTIYLCVVDRDLNVCSFVNSIAYAFGSAIVSAKSVCCCRIVGPDLHRTWPCELHCARQASFTHATCRARHEEQTCHYAIRCDGRSVSSRRSGSCTKQYCRFRHGCAGGDRSRAGLSLCRHLSVEFGISNAAMMELERLGHVVARSEGPIGGGRRSGSIGVAACLPVAQIHARTGARWVIDVRTAAQNNNPVATSTGG